MVVAVAGEALLEPRVEPQQREQDARFGVTPQLEDCIKNFQEEVRELIEAARDGSDKAHIAEESADVFVTAIGVCFAAGLDVDRLVEQVYTVIAKNDAKTHETHAYSDGKIRRLK